MAGRKPAINFQTRSGKYKWELWIPEEILTAEVELSEAVERIYQNVAAGT